MIPRKNISRVLHRFGCLLSICLLMLAVLVAPPIVSAGHADNMPVVATMVGQQTQHPTNCHSASACAAIVVPADISLQAMRRLQSLRFVISDATRQVQFGPSTESPPPRA